MTMKRETRASQEPASADSDLSSSLPVAPVPKSRKRLHSEVESIENESSEEPAMTKKGETRASQEPASADSDLSSSLPVAPVPKSRKRLHSEEESIENESSEEPAKMDYRKHSFFYLRTFFRDFLNFYRDLVKAKITPQHKKDKKLPLSLFEEIINELSPGLIVHVS